MVVLFRRKLFLLPAQGFVGIVGRALIDNPGNQIESKRRLYAKAPTTKYATKIIQLRIEN